MINVSISHFNNPELEIALKHEFEFCANVKIVPNDILEIECDAIVSPGNSFGFMDGGVDLSISKHFGWGIQQELRSQISELPMKELLIGQALCIPTNRERVKFVICTPTMRIPTNHNIGDSVNAYLATKAALELANKNSEIQCLAFTGLCTGTGEMHPAVSAKQMFSAYEEVILGKVREFPTYMDAAKFHRSLISKKRY